jgi:hypothetical protein
VSIQTRLPPYKELDSVLGVEEQRMKNAKHPDACPGCHEVRDCVCPPVCQDAKCAAAKDHADLCADHRAEYEQYLDDMAQLAKIQEQYEQGA